MKIKVHKTKDYTIMSNIHLRDKRLTLKAKGLLSLMFSLPEKWDYSVYGLTTICKEGAGSIISTLKELEECSYLIRERKKDNAGKFTGIEYQVYEKPFVENPHMDKPNVENQPQLNKEELNKEKSNKEQCVLPPTPIEKIIPPVRKQDGGSTEEQIELMADMLANTPAELPKIIALLRWALCQIDFQSLFAFVADYSVMGGKGYEAFKQKLLDLLGEQQ